MRWVARRGMAAAAALLVLWAANPGGCAGPRPVAERPPPRANPVARLAAQLKGNDWQQRADAVRRLGATRHTDAVGPLAGAMGDRDMRVRLAVVQACGAHRSPRLIPALKKGVIDKERPVRIHAVRSLARISTREAAEAMIEALDGASMWLRPEVADGLSAMGVKALAGLEVAVQILVAELDPARKPRLRRLAAALAAVGEPALRILVLAVYKPAGLLAKKPIPGDTKCLRGPCRALVAMGPRVLFNLSRMGRDGIHGINVWNLYRRILPTIAVNIGKPAIPFAIGYVGKSGSRGKLADITLSQMGSVAVQPLTTLLRKRGQSTRVRIAVVRLLALIRDLAATSALVEALGDPARDVQQAAAKALVTQATQTAFAALATRIQSGSLAQRWAIVRGVRHTRGRPATRLLLLALGQSALDVRLSAVHALGRRKDTLAIPALAAIITKAPGKMHLAAVQALGRIGDKRATRWLLTLLKARVPSGLKLFVIRALGLLKDPRAYGGLARLARRGKMKLRLQAIQSLGEIGTKRANNLLGRLKRSGNKTIAKAASEAHR